MSLWRLVNSLWNACEACGNCDKISSLLMWEGHSKARCWEEGGGQEGNTPDWWKPHRKKEAS